MKAFFKLLFHFRESAHSNCVTLWIMNCVWATFKYIHATACLPASRLVSQPFSKPVSQPFSKSVSQPASQPASQSASQPVSQPATQSASRSASQPADQPASQPISQPASRSASQPASRLAAKSASQNRPIATQSTWQLLCTQRKDHSADCYHVYL